MPSLLADLLPVALKMSAILYLFTLGLESSSQGATYVARNPGLLARSLLSMNIIMPLFAAAVMASVGFHPAIKIAIIALALSPVPPGLPITKGGNLEYAINMLVVSALLAIALYLPAWNWSPRFLRRKSM